MFDGSVFLKINSFKSFSQNDDSRLENNFNTAIKDVNFLISAQISKKNDQFFLAVYLHCDETQKRK